jgi:hypothetical protein
VHPQRHAVLATPSGESSLGVLNAEVAVLGHCWVVRGGEVGGIAPRGSGPPSSDRDEGLAARGLSRFLSSLNSGRERVLERGRLGEILFLHSFF